MKQTQQLMAHREPDADDYAAQDDARTLVRAEEIRGDKRRHAKAHKHLKRQHEATRRAIGNPFAKVLQ